MDDTFPTHAYASLSKRLFAQMLDGFIPLIIVVTCVMAVSSIRTGGHVALLLAFMLCLGYVLLADGFSNGQSIGKRIMRIKVVHAKTGASCSYLQSVIRNCTRVLSILDWIPVFDDETRKRLGDRLAKTVVVEA